MAGKSTYTPEMGDRICELLSTTDCGIKKVLQIIAEERKAAGLEWSPCVMTIWNWEDTHPESKAQMETARKRQGTLIHDLAGEWAATPLRGHVTKIIKKPDGREIHRTSSDNVERSKLMVQTALKRAGQLAPSKYGEKVQAEISGELAIKRVVSDL
jgi:L-fucose isomerase-like protein